MALNPKKVQAQDHTRIYELLRQGAHYLSILEPFTPCHRVHVTVQRWGDTVHYRARCHETECAFAHNYETLERATWNAHNHCQKMNNVLTIKPRRVWLNDAKLAHYRRRSFEAPTDH